MTPVNNKSPNLGDFKIPLYCGNEKTGTHTGTLQIESNWVGFHLNLTFNGNNVAAEGTMKENMGKELPAKGTFNKR